MEQFEINDMPNDFMKQYAESFGLPAAIQFMGIFGGEYCYIPKLEAVKEKRRIYQARETIIKEFTVYRKKQYRKLARKFKVSKDYVVKVLKEAFPDNL